MEDKNKIKTLGTERCENIRPLYTIRQINDWIEKVDIYTVKFTVF